MREWRTARMGRTREGSSRGNTMMMDSPGVAVSRHCSNTWNVDRW